MIGRDKEKAELQRCMDSDRSEFVIVYGRRRVGKTFLIDEFFKGQYDFTYVGGHNLTPRMQLRSRMGLFRDHTHTTKALVNTFVTTFGVANGIHSGIVNSEVTLNRLFDE